MLLTKIIGCFLVITSSTSMGLYISSELKGRVEDLRELRKLMVLLRGDIRFAKTPLPEAINSIARRHEGVYKSFFTKVYVGLDELSGASFTQIWKEAVEKELDNTSLAKKDRLLLSQFGENLGYLDKEMQMNTMDLYITQLEDEIGELSKTVKEKSYLYSSLGIMAGIFISIVLL
ncbi:MAG: hypothetical protein GX288_11215 [Clostridiales bacterium]|nr:hypothetical protein [Clostridiales bacterium]